MALIHINRNRENLGKFTDQDVADGLQSGKFLPTDLAWQEPMPAWQDLSTFKDLPPPSDVELGNASPVAMEDSSPVSIEPAWERTTQSPGLGDAIETIKQVFFEPAMVFRQMPTSGGYNRPIRFYVITGWVSGFTAVTYQLVASLLNPEMFLGEASKELTQGTIITIFVSSSLFHFALRLVGGATKPFEATFRAIAYASGATSILQFIPLCGGYLYPIANLIYSVIALREAHRTEMWRVVLALLLLLILCCGIVFAMAAVIVGLASAVSHGFSK
jgi:hypothetical protein